MVSSPEPKWSRSLSHDGLKMTTRGTSTFCASTYLAFAISVVFSVAFGPAALSAEQARVTQFLFVIDDSGSMSGRNATDPDRLAVFAVEAIMSMLDDGDEVSLVRLNGDSAEDQDIKPLSASRANIDSQLALDGSLAAYKGAWTPCRSAIDRAKILLNRAYRPEVFQVVMFLTDGACEPDGQEPDPSAFLDGLSSHADGRFQFYFLRFAGRKYSRNLDKLAEVTNGNAIEVGAGDPSTILFPFAKALSRSQGYEAYVLSARDNTLKAHQGARRIRLLAVAPDEGSDLRVALSSRGQGNPSREMGSPRSGTHQYQSGKKYRYTSIDYAPSEGGSVVSVTGASNWRVVVFPEYKLVLKQKVLQGACGTNGPAAQSIDLGSDICALLELVNDEDKPVTDLGNEAAGFINYTAPGGSPERLRANREGSDLKFLMGKSRLEIRGRHQMSPFVTLTFPDHHAVEFAGTPWEVDVSSSLIRCTPAEITAGDLVPGAEYQHAFQCDGNFPPTSARLVVQDASALPPCIKFDVNGSTDGIQITAGQPYTLGVRIGSFCGVSAINREYDINVQIEFAQGASKLPAQNFTAHLKLDSSFACAFKPVEIVGGNNTVMELQCQTNAVKDMEYTVVLPDLSDGESVGWDAEHLKIGFADEDDRIARDDAGNVLRKKNVKIASDGSGAPVRLILAADRCCVDGDNELKALFVPKGQGYDPTDAARIPINVKSVSPGLWSCRGPLILKIIGIVLLLLLIAYIVNMFRNSSFFNVKRFSEKFVPLEWDERGNGVNALKFKNSAKVPQRLRSGSLGYFNRAANWLQSNPLKFGLPGGRYVETALVNLSAGKKTEPEASISMTLQPVANLKAELAARVGKKEVSSLPFGMLYVQAVGRDVEFFAVVNSNDERFSGMCELQNIGLAMNQSAGYLEVKPRLRQSIKNLKVVKPVDEADRIDTGRIAGWKIG